MKDETIDNQQPSIDFDRGWLAGIIDGEGCIQLAKQKYPHGNGVHYRPQIVIGNNNPAIIEKIVAICKQYSIPVYVLERKKRFSGQARQYLIQIMGLKRCKVWCDYFGDTLIGKKLQIQIMREFIGYRLSLPSVKHKGVYTFGERDEGYRVKMNEANAAYRSIHGSTTTR